MARIATYSQDTSISNNDLLVGTDAEDSNITKNYKIGDVKDFIAGTQLVTTKVTITSTQLGDLSGTDSIELIAAPGENKVIVPVSIACFLDYNTEAYNFSANLAIANKPADHLAELPIANLNAISDQHFVADLFDAGVNLSDNVALNLNANNTTVNTGDSPLTLSIAYRIVDFS